jgi:glycosyltransferase involved in cell wall biosynthesis
MRVALLDLPSYTPPYDHSLASGLARRGHEVTLLTTRFPYGEAPRPEGYRREELFFPVSARLRRLAPRSKVHRVVKAAEYLPSVARLRRRLERLEPDVVHVQWLALPGRDLRWLRALGRPTVFTAHDLLGRRRDRRETWLAVCRVVDRVVVHSPAGADELAAAGIARERIAVIPHPVFESSAHEPSAPNGTTLFFFGLLRAYKGVDLLIRALPSIPGARAVIAGDPLEPAEPLQRLAEDEGVAGRIEWRLGFLPDEEIAELLARSVAVVLPYRHAGSSGVLATALGHGRPAVVSDIPGLAENVGRYGAGLTFHAGDVEALAEACRAVLADPAPYFEGALAARAALGWDAAAEAHERLYGDIVELRARPS